MVGNRMVRSSVVVVSVLGLGTWACSDDPKGSTSDITCGQGTVLRGGQCVADTDSGGLGSGGSSPGSSGGSPAAGGASGGSGGVNPGAGGLGTSGGATSAGGMDGGSSGDGGSGDAGPGDGGSADGGPGDAAGDGGGEPPLVLVDLDCGNRDLAGAIQVSGAITQDTRWSGIVHVTASTNLRNEATLTIAPGTKVFVAAGAEIDIGWQGSRPTLVAAGTPDQPIRICGEAGQPGYWSRLIVQANVSPASVLRNVLVAEAGARSAGAALVLHAPIAVQGVQVVDSGVDGVASDVFGPGSRRLSVKGSAGVPLDATAIDGLKVPPDSVFADNTEEAIRVSAPRIDRDVTLQDWGIPYRQVAEMGGATVADGPVTFGLAPGVVYEIHRTTTLDLGSATLVAVGTDAAPVVFRPVDCAFDIGCQIFGATQAGQVRIGAESSGSRIEHVQMERGGRTTGSSSNVTRHGALVIEATAQVSLQDVSLQDAYPIGIEFSGRSGGLTDDSARVHIDLDAPVGASGVPASLLLHSNDCTELGHLGQGFTFGDRARVELACSSARTPITIKDLGVPYSLVRDFPFTGFYMEAPVTIEPGTIFDLLDVEIHVIAGGSLTAHGTESAPIRFRNRVAYGWGGLYIDGGTVDLDRVHVSVNQSGVNPNTGAIRAAVPFQIRNSTIEGARGYGILRQATDTTDYLTTNTFLDNSAGDVGTIP